MKKTISILGSTGSIGASLFKIIDKLNPKKYSEIECSTKSFRPWGSFKILEESKNFKVKELIINPKSSISLQKHAKRSEHWVVVEGEVIATKGKQRIKLKTNRSIDIKTGEMHRLQNESNKSCRIIEVQTGDYLGEDDIIRYEDIYNRELS